MSGEERYRAPQNPSVANRPGHPTRGTTRTAKTMQQTHGEMKTCSHCWTLRPLSQFLPARDGRRISRCVTCIKQAAQRHRDRAAAAAKSARQSRVVRKPAKRKARVPEGRPVARIFGTRTPS